MCYMTLPVQGHRFLSDILCNTLQSELNADCEVWFLLHKQVQGDRLSTVALLCISS